MPEAKLAREAEMSYAMVALVTDYDCWKSKSGESGGAATLLEEIRGNLATASGRAMELIRRAIGRMAEQREALLAARARSALKLAIWSEKSRIAAEEIERLRPLWGRYF
jgi:5'-methylthioadenosine phosphorylase